VTYDWVVQNYTDMVMLCGNSMQVEEALSGVGAFCFSGFEASIDAMKACFGHKCSPEINSFFPQTASRKLTPCR